MRPKEIKQLRKDLGWSQAKLANHLGYTAQAVLKWERGMSPPPDIVIGVLTKLKNELAKKKAAQKQEFIEGLALAGITGGILLFMEYIFNKESDD